MVVGGGIAGLAAAFVARAAAETVPGGLDVLVLERDPEIGGKARTVVRDGWLVEGGPAGFLSGRTELDNLVTACELGPRLVQANAAAARRYIYSRGKLRRVTANPVALLRSGLLRFPGLARLLADIVLPARRDQADETIWDFAARRFGAEVADRLIAPVTLGVVAGDAHRLSVAANFPRFTAIERNHGSIIRGLIADRKNIQSGRLTSFVGGMSELPHALADRGGFRALPDSGVKAVAPADPGWQLHLNDGTSITADVVIIATDSAAAASILRVSSARLAAELQAITCPPVSVVALGYGPATRQRIPTGFGVLVARGEGFRMLGNVWDDQVFPGRCPEGHVLIRAIYGGGVDPDIGGLTPGELVALARGELARMYGIAEAPLLEQVIRWPLGIPQYAVGHVARVARIEEMVAAQPGLFMTGWALHGVAFASAAEHGVRTGERAIEWLSRV